MGTADARMGQVRRFLAKTAIKSRLHVKCASLTWPYNRLLGEGPFAPGIFRAYRRPPFHNKSCPGVPLSAQNLGLTLRKRP
jgi:hypothetical protein